MATAAKRLLTNRSVTTWVALRNASSVAAWSPIVQWKHRLFGASSCTNDELLNALAVSTTVGSGSYSTSTSSAASRATYGDSAMTTATASPTCRARSTASGYRGGIL